MLAAWSQSATTGRTSAHSLHPWWLVDGAIRYAPPARSGQAVCADHARAAAAIPGVALGKRAGLLALVRNTGGVRAVARLSPLRVSSRFWHATGARQYYSLAGPLLSAVQYRD